MCDTQDENKKRLVFNPYNAGIRVYVLRTLMSTTVDILSFYKHLLNPFKPEFTIVIFIHYKPRIAVAILDL